MVRTIEDLIVESPASAKHIKERIALTITVKRVYHEPEPSWSQRVSPSDLYWAVYFMIAELIPSPWKRLKKVGGARTTA